MKRMIGAALLIVLVTACAKRSDDRGMGAGADTTGMRDTTRHDTSMVAPAPADTTKPPQN